MMMMTMVRTRMIKITRLDSRQQCSARLLQKCVSYISFLYYCIVALSSSSLHRGCPEPVAPPCPLCIRRYCYYYYYAHHYLHHSCLLLLILLLIFLRPWPWPLWRSTPVMHAQVPIITITAIIFINACMFPERQGRGPPWRPMPAMHCEALIGVNIVFTFDIAFYHGWQGPGGSNTFFDFIFITLIIRC